MPGEVVVLAGLAWLISLLRHFAPVFSARVGRYTHGLLAGAMPAPGPRTVTSCLRLVGGSGEHRFVNSPPGAEARSLAWPGGQRHPSPLAGHSVGLRWSDGPRHRGHQRAPPG